MRVIDWHRKISDLTIQELFDLQTTIFKPEVRRYEYGIKGIAKIFGCSRDKAQKIKKSGVIDGAIYQNKKIIVVDVDLALELFRQNN